jgi:hypothetical protein
MKKNMFKLMTALLMLVLSYSNTIAQDCMFSKITNSNQYKIDKLESKWQDYLNDPGFKAIFEYVKKMGFTRIAKNEKAAWGFDANFVLDSTLGTSEQYAEFCGFDFYKKTDKGIQMCSIIWREVGNTIYKACIIFPEGENDSKIALEKSQEYFADKNNKIQLAHSFGKCWAKCVFKRLNSTKCAAAIVGCGAAAGGLTLAGLGVTTGFAIGVFAVCASWSCIMPLAICAAYCL